MNQGILLVLSTYFLASGSDSTHRFEADLVRLMNGKFAPTTIHSTIAIKNGTALATFSGDQTSSSIEVLYLLFANSSKQISQVELTRDGKSKLTLFKLPHNEISTSDDDILFNITDNSTWTGNATFPLGENTMYSLAARLEGLDADDPSSYLCSYVVPNAGVSLPDLHVLDRYTQLENI
ncbi:Hypothetical protein NTJ_04283 [Nesidiocoris tenuis]|uniref:Uncharacterized protein n=1 Tax=Nesidiocoris tenuis TaxID=355587 RepID=A0ABN7AGT5_9HEMI|nr:Hypothetical protein NTJ_04283 [Nesidiocoris tenuis]